MMLAYKDRADLQDFDDEDDLSDDEVFTQGGKSVSVDDNGVNKPLMAARQRTKDSFTTHVRKVPPIRVIWAPTLYFLITLSTVIGIICLVVFLINAFMRNATRNGTPNLSSEKKKWQPCSKITTHDVWIKTFPKLTTETAVRLNDVNSDGIDDIILGFGTGADAFYYPSVVCRVYFPDAKDACGGGVLALDGKTGKEIWRHYTQHEIFALNCNIDLDEDGVKDCAGAGRMATFRAISGKDGKLIWNFEDPYAKVETSNVYTPQYVNDIDFDGVPDLVAIHGGDPLKKPGSKTRLVGRLLIVSGKTGQILRWVQVPDGKESYYSPQVITRPDGTQIVLFGTGGETHGGSLWYIQLKHLASRDIKKAQAIYTDEKKGIMTPPVLIDITGDGISDIIMAMFNSSVIAFNGLTFARLWEYQQPSSESYSTPGVGYFNNDSSPDFIINYQTGPGFPIYYYTQTTILDGRNGLPLLKKPIKMVVGTQSSPLVVSVEGQGNDIFLFWVSDCHGSKNFSKLEFDFIKGTTVHEQSRADFCKIRFKEKLFTRMYALSSHVEPPGTMVYDSDKRKDIEYSNPINYTALGLEFLYRHPEYEEDYMRYLGNMDNAQTYDYSDVPENNYFNNHYDDVRLQEALNSQRVPDGRNFPSDYPSSDRNSDYWFDDRQSPTSYSPYFAPQHFQNLGNPYYYPSQYHQHLPQNGPPFNVQRHLPPPQKGWPRQVSVDPKLYRRYQQRTGRDLNHYITEKHSRVRRHHKKNTVKSGDAKNRKQVKRHVGPHDGGGIQRIISTGTLAPSIKYKSGVDIVFATFWFNPSSAQGLLPEDKECVVAGMQQEEERFRTSNQFYGMDHDAYEEMVTEECLRANGHLRRKDGHNDNEYNPFNRPMGQLTVYRVHIDCDCNETLTKGEQCAKILPFDQQMWPSYMGRYGNSAATIRN